jgi:anaerobic selenocysteine-containing dehydrogenase
MTTTPNEPRGEEQIHYRTCPLCEATCGLEMTVRDGRVASVRGDEQDVFSKGYLCPKGANLAALHEDPDRLRTPMIREGTGWREVGYDEAFAEIERRLLPILERGGRNALGVYLGNPNVHNLGGALYLRPLLKAFRTKQIFSASTVDQMPTHVACGLMYGSPGAIPVPDVDRCDYLLMIGANPLESNGSGGFASCDAAAASSSSSIRARPAPPSWPTRTSRFVLRRMSISCSVSVTCSSRRGWSDWARRNTSSAVWTKCASG